MALLVFASDGGGVRLAVRDMSRDCHFAAVPALA